MPTGAKFFTLLFFAAILAHGSTIGMSDDEAYYWVLAQRPSLGFAFHPPMVVWSIAAVQALLGWATGPASVFLVRLTSAVYAAGILWLCLDWVRRAAGARGISAGAVTMLLSFGGLFSIAWMMVPDLPLLFGGLLAMHATWRICFEDRAPYGALFLGIALALLSKFSAGLFAVSCLASVAIWRRDRAARVVAVLAAATVIAAIPILIWNSQHEWGALLYQFKDRHGGGSFSLARGAKFWLAQLALAGPGIIAMAFALPLLRADRAARFIAAWSLPALAIFGTQPFFSDFKLHWVFVAWLPVAAWLALEAQRGRSSGLMTAQRFWGLLVFALMVAVCRAPLVSWATASWTGQVPDFRSDVSHDLRGWEKLREVVSEEPRLPVVGSRYQTAAQAAFALGDVARVSLVPRDLKQRDEWVSLAAVDFQGPEWPRLLSPVYFVADGRYAAGPEFRDTICEKKGDYQSPRWGIPGKSISVWRCRPAGGS